MNVVLPIELRADDRIDRRLREALRPERGAS
jgi:hypothetical protein